MKINVFYNTPVPLKHRKTAAFKAGVLLALGAHAKTKGEANVIFIDEKEIRKINKQHLSHDYVTDVISFNYPPGAGAFGDIFICYGVAVKNAPAYGKSAQEEMLMYAAHGALHLAGMDDRTKAQRAEMDKKAEVIIKKLRSGL